MSKVGGAPETVHVPKIVKSTPFIHELSHVFDAYISTLKCEGGGGVVDFMVLCTWTVLGAPTLCHSNQAFSKSFLNKEN
jgi:hypothetical protein